ncbi:10932_t:CDS:1, partial [Dentiscutata heterogama]
QGLEIIIAFDSLDKLENNHADSLDKAWNNHAIRFFRQGLEIIIPFDSFVIRFGQVTGYGLIEE